MVIFPEITTSEMLKTFHQQITIYFRDFITSMWHALQNIGLVVSLACTWAVIFCLFCFFKYSFVKMMLCFSGQNQITLR